MRATRGAARAHIGTVALGAALCAWPALRPGAATPWTTLALLAGLYLACELLARRPFPVGFVGAGSFFPLLLAAAFLLPPPAAALVAVPGSLAGRAGKPPAA
ncbi:metal-dependent phosphohydrolase, partial [Streptomyces sp. SID9727]|nr:metal-dependent phosphohydrolase [Streptomyces sp. SID9727]